MQIRGGSRTAATSKVELFVIIVNGFQSSTIITKSSTLHVAAVLDPPLQIVKNRQEALLRVFIISFEHIQETDRISCKSRFHFRGVLRTLQNI